MQTLFLLITLTHITLISAAFDVLSNEWLSMTQSEAVDYYTAAEVCRLVKGDNCESEPEPQHLDHMTDACIDHMAFFKRHNSMHPWPESKSFGDVFKMMFEKGSNSIFLIGDSITSLFMHNLQYIAKQESFDEFSFEDNHFTGFSSVEISVPRSYIVAEATPPSIQVHFMNLATVDSPEQFIVIKNSTKKAIDDQLSNGKGKALFIINLGLHFQYNGAPVKAEFPEEYRKEVEGRHRNYKTLLGDFLPMFVDYAKDKHTVIFRETSATHWPSEIGVQDKSVLGDYPNKPHPPRENATSLISTIAARLFSKLDPPPFSDESGGRFVVTSQAFPDVTFSYCKPIKDEQAYNEQNWQNPMVVEMLAELDPDGLIGVAPFFQMSAARFDVHNGRDCTHFCAMPLLYAPVWDFIARYYEKMGSS